VIEIRLLGGLEIRRGADRVPPLESARVESLLAYLALHRHTAQQRQRIAFTLWPDSTEAQALTNLRHVLHNLRRSLPEADQLIDARPRTLHWRPAVPVWLDTAEFDNAIAAGDLAAAAAVYAGDLLAGRMDEWVEEHRVRLRRRYLDALEQLVTACSEQGELADAVRYAERLLREEPLREHTYRVLIRLHDARGDRARAVRVYHDCAATLERELGVEPAAETRATYDALLARDERPAATRLGGPPFVGRTAERAALAAAWRDARPGRPHVVLLAGESGIGKTRLAEEFRAWAAHRGAVTAVARAYPGEGALAYGPIVAWLRSEDLNGRLRVLARPYLTELARLLPELVASVPGLTRPQRLPESEQRQRLYDAVVTALVAPDTPLVLVADDVQWWDGDALQLLHYLIRSRPAAPLLVVATTRREEMDTSGPLREILVALRLAGTLSEIDLDRLNRTETGLLAEQIGQRPITDAAIAALYEHTEGNPLFVVEALRAGWQVGGDVLTPKVHAVIQSRLAQLSSAARELVDVAATVGREFTAEVLSLASRTNEDAVVHALDELWRRRIIREHNAVAYDFSHDTIREVAYAALSPMRRRYLHGRVAQALATEFAGDLDSISGQLARHYEQAGALDQAVCAYAGAADVAQQLYAHGESARLLSRGLELLTRLPASVQRARRELELSTALLAPLVATEGYASPQIHEAHQRALTLARSLGAEPSPPLLRSMGLGSLARGDFAAAKEYGAADELGITVGLMPAPPSPFMPPDQFGKPVVALILAWTGDPAEANKS
jgi:DNA-binding SARP family transcriptional activator